jgi:hypothetical protein
MGDNPYRELPDHRFWRRGVAALERHRLDPVVGARFRIAREARVATAGSCFAQHISRRLQAIGFRYFVAEDAPALSAEARRARNYGVFSARYGNLYTARQLLQLFERAYGRFVPVEPAWRRGDGRLADPFRPNIEPDGFASEGVLFADREAHFAAVRWMFEATDVFVFTLGLTEAWRSREDGAVFPLAPGVAAGSFDPQRHEFVNLGVADTVADLRAFLAGLRRVNPRAKVLLTVSPVPLVATYEDRHVLVATTYSKSVLRVAAEEIVREDAGVDYFPSYEIITGSFNEGAYYEADHREVSEGGVAHAMRCFLRHYAEGMEAPATPDAPGATAHAAVAAAAPANELICDEEAIDQVDV